MSPSMNTAVLKIYSAELIGLAGRLFEAELNGDDTDRDIIKRRMREAIAMLNRWQCSHLDILPLDVSFPATPMEAV